MQSLFEQQSQNTCALSSCNPINTSSSNQETPTAVFQQESNQYSLAAIKNRCHNIFLQSNQYSSSSNFKTPAQHLSIIQSILKDAISSINPKTPAWRNLSVIWAAIAKHSPGQQHLTAIHDDIILSRYFIVGRAYRKHYFRLNDSNSICYMLIKRCQE